MSNHLIFNHAATMMYLRKWKNQGNRPAPTDDGRLKSFAGEIRQYIPFTRSQGNPSVVKSCRRGDPDYGFAYSEDHTWQSIEWIDPD